ncbi:MAG: isoprenylcysteine carboxylmethyltransferase family protein [Clostridia bacterium]|nr:isoprenylcysteine carboxylmethyltransferase family protein [Clostridia bacterium]
MRLLFSALIKLLVGALLVAALLFIPAGRFSYLGAWLLIGLLFIPMTVLGTVLFIKSPELLKKRLNAKEKLGSQSAIVLLSAVIFIAGFTVAGLDRRFGWTKIPLWVTVFSCVLFLISYALYAEVMRENAYLSRTVEVVEGQKIIDTGLYGIVRHPMYFASVLMFLSMPLILGSWWSLLCFAPYIFLIAARIISEERLLLRELPGYGEYRKRVRYRILPFIW